MCFCTDNNTALANNNAMEMILKQLETVMKGVPGKQTLNNIHRLGAILNIIINCLDAHKCKIFESDIAMIINFCL